MPYQPRPKWACLEDMLADVTGFCLKHYGSAAVNFRETLADGREIQVPHGADPPHINGESPSGGGDLSDIEADCVMVIVEADRFLTGPQVHAALRAAGKTEHSLPQVAKALVELAKPHRAVLFNDRKRGYGLPEWKNRS